MSTARERAQRTIDAVFTHDGVDADYVPPLAGAAVPCRVLVDSRDRHPQIGFGRPVVEGTVLEVRDSELSPAKGGVFSIDGEDFKVLDDPATEDPDRLVWTSTVALRTYGPSLDMSHTLNGNYRMMGWI